MKNKWWKIQVILLGIITTILYGMEYFSDKDIVWPVFLAILAGVATIFLIALFIKELHASGIQSPDNADKPE